jgi:SAM-dependent methyltransferase
VVQLFRSRSAEGITDTNMENRAVSKSDLIQVRVECAEHGPYVKEVHEFLAASDNLGFGHSEAFGFKCNLALALFHLKEKLDAGKENPVPIFRNALIQQAKAIRAVADVQSGRDLEVETADLSGDESVMTGDHYGGLFADYDEWHYFDEPVALLRQRLERNGFSLRNREDLALDAGCGSGRYTVAMRKLGFIQVLGVDISPLNIKEATRRCRDADLDGVDYKLGNMLDLPVPNESCGFVFSNGVVHHTGNIRLGLSEIRRVLKPGGTAYFKIMPNPGGIHWDVVELLRYLMRDVPYDVARRHFALAGVAPNRRYFILDHIMVPINDRITAAECEHLIRQVGFTKYERCNRGADVDRLELRYRQTPFASEKYGDGVNLYRLVR